MSHQVTDKPNAREEGDMFKLRIDRDNFEVAKEIITGLELRDLPKPPIADDRDLYEEIPGGEDKLIAKTDLVTLNEGVTMFFTSPSHVTPGG